MDSGDIFKRVPLRTKVLVRDLATILLKDGLTEQFKRGAATKAKSLKPADLRDLESMLYDPPKKPSTYDFEKHGLSGWLSACQFAIFELIYNLGDDALPIVRRIAWGEYDWTQGNAIELLIRFAADGIERKEIIEEIRRGFPNIRCEAQAYAIRPMLQELDTHPQLRKVFDELMCVDAFQEIYSELVEN